MQGKNKKLALVTGANRGIGFEVSRQLAQEGIQVVMASRDSEKGLEAAKKLQNEGLDVVHCQLDVTDSGSINKARDFISKKYGRLDILINNAGIAIDPKGRPSLLRVDIDTFQKTIDTNTFGPIRLLQAFIPMMQEHKYGRVVNISSGMGQLSEMNSGWPGYRISKTALNAVTRIIADELQGTNILVNSACPGWVKTDMGGPEAELTPKEGADTIVWLATLPEDGPTGSFFRQRKRIEW